MKKSGRKEKGIALVFSLMILALLLILALGFALNSMFDQKAAYNSASKSFAGFLAQTQMQQLLSLIHNDEVNLDNHMLYSRNSGSPAVTDPNMLKDMLKERLPIASVLDKAKVDTAKVNWNYVRSKDSSQRIIGRTAFVVISEGISPASVVDGRIGTTDYPKHDETNDTESRIGKYTSEINIRNTVPVTASILGLKANDMSAVFNWQNGKPVAGAGFPSGKFTGSWMSFEHIFAIIDAALSPSALTDDDKKEFRDNLSLITAEDKEAFWADLGRDTKVAPSEFYKRFDLTRADWNTTDHVADLTFLKNKLLLTNATVPNLDMEAWTDTDSGSNSKGIPWLACFGYKDDGSGNGIIDSGAKGNFASVVERRRQIAANLKDYCDTDIRPTSDVDPKNWKTTEPAFTGNEKTPYLNKVGFEVSAIVDSTANSTDSSKYDVTLDVSVRPCAELAYIYNGTWSDSLEVYIEGSVDLKLTNGTTLTPTLSLKTTPSKNITTSTYTDGYSNLLLASNFTDSITSFTTTARTSNDCKIEVTGFRITKVVVHSADAAKNGYDYTKLLTGSKSLAFNVSKGSPQSGWCGFACHDPRQNLHQADWAELTPDYSDSGNAPANVFSITSSYTGMPNALNSSNGGGYDTEAPATGPDPETVNDPVKISTTFFRNAPIESPWELGFIHRGARWQTLNLKKYDSSKAFSTIDIGGKKYLAGGGTYTDGDANILDQIKMTSAAKSPQKIKLLSTRIKNLEALFSKLKLGCTIDNTMSVTSIAAGGTPSELSDSQKNYFATKIMTKYQSAADPDTKKTRASVVDLLALPDTSAPPAPGGITATTDAMQEELIGKIVNLTEASGKLSGFTVIVLAQTIKDIGGAAGSQISINKYSGDLSVSASRNCETGIFDAQINDPDNNKKNIYFDEITAEQKILARCYRDVDGTIKVTSIRYVE
jgi:Tfp pilus assembly protein PilX